MIKLKNLLLEINQGLMRWYKSQLPDWPDYVIKDMIYLTTKDLSLQDKIQYINDIKKDFPEIKWKLETLELSFDKFSKKTQEKMLHRKMGKENPYGVPNDEKRHQTQLDLLKKRGVSKQPIIVVKRPDGYELLEGWHRTLQNLQAFPEGYKGSAWVGYF